MDSTNSKTKQSNQDVQDIHKQPEQSQDAPKQEPKKRGVAKKVGLWLISPGNPFPSGTGKILKNAMVARKNLTALNEIRAARIELEKDKQFEDYVTEYGLNDVELAKREKRNRKTSVFYGLIALIFLDRKSVV